MIDVWQCWSLSSRQNPCPQTVRRAMENFRIIPSSQSSLYHWMALLVISFCSFREVFPLGVNMTSSLPSKGLLDPIEVSPSIIPHDQSPMEPLSPMYPSFPTTYKPILTGRCPLNFSEISTIIDLTASDCSAPLAPLVGNVICCPQVNSLMHIFLGNYGKYSGKLALPQAQAEDCFSDVMSVLTSRGSNSTIPKICSLDSVLMTGGSCPVIDTETLEKTVNTSKLLDSCGTVDPLKECCRPVCLPAIMEAAFQISLRVSRPLDSSKVPGKTVGADIMSDCKGVIHSWLSQKLSPTDANNALRMLSSCKVNKVCPLRFEDPAAVIRACRDVASGKPSISCCSSLNGYIAEVQKQMLITNRQAINCAMLFGSLLQKGGVLANVYDLCNVDLKDFSLQAYRQRGCLLRSLPADVLYDNFTGYSFTCDLSDNIAAPWPSSSSLSTFSLCAPEMSLPALPVAQTSGAPGCSGKLVGFALVVVLMSLCYNGKHFQGGGTGLIGRSSEGQQRQQQRTSSHAKQSLRVRRGVLSQRPSRSSDDWRRGDGENVYLRWPGPVLIGRELGLGGVEE